jgi:hypothetical protein
MAQIHIGPCKCGGYGQCFDGQAENEIGICHRGAGGDIFGHFVTAKLKDKDDCRQGIVISVNPLILRGKLGDYECEGPPTIVGV